MGIMYTVLVKLKEETTSDKILSKVWNRIMVFNPLLGKLWISQ